MGKILWVRIFKEWLNKVMVFGVTAGVALICMPAGNAGAAGVTYKDGDKWVKLGGRIQAQYHMTDPENGDSYDELLFRRLRLYVEGSLHKDWKGKFQIDFGKSEVAIKDAFLRYLGIEGMEISVGNQNFPFSRELITSSKYQQLVERTFVGDHNYGTPDRQTGIHLEGEGVGKKWTYGFSLVSACIDPDAKKLDFDTAVNNDADDWNEGFMLGGRADFHPFGLLKFSQGDFSGETLATIGLGAFTWSNDDDNNTYTDETTGLIVGSKPDVEKVNGFEISAAFRAAGFSVDAQYNIFDAETVDPTFTGGIYRNGETELTNYAIEGGYMVVPAKLEFVAGYQAMDADNYDHVWSRTSIGMNYFFKKHDIKIQATYRMGESLDGKKDKDANELFLQAQYVF
jgi:phosphate-selective porin OprO/OprP